MRYIDLVSTAELDFESSFQGYPTCLYLSHMVRWPDGHKWPLCHMKMIMLVVYFPLRIFSWEKEANVIMHSIDLNKEGKECQMPFFSI